jgi:predicted RNA-binding Zn ribbon-like protein
MADAVAKPEFQFIAGRLCLDFANTVDYRNSPQEVDQLNTCADVIAWAEQAGIVSGAEAQQMKRAAKNESSAETALRHALTLREAIFEIISAAVNRTPAPEMPVHFLNRTLRDAGGQRILTAGKDGFTWKWNAPAGHLEWILWPVAQDAGELLTSDDLARVRECSAEDCGWLFMDRSKNRSRRWCEMRNCGNRDKARRYYERARAQINSHRR